MFSQIKSLAGQTIIYGIPSILGRLLNWLLVPLYTYNMLPAEYSVVTEMYSYTAFLFILLTLGMETTYFRFCKDTSDENKVFNNTLLPVLFISIFFGIFVLLFQTSLAKLIDYPDNKHYIYITAWILVFDALSSIPFARLRQKNKAIKFASIKLINIALTIGLNLFLILLMPFLAKLTDWSFLSYFLEKGKIVSLILFSNLLASGISLFLLYKEFEGFSLKISKEYQKQILKYALPLVFVGLAGTVNEVLDRILLKYLLPEPDNKIQLGIYGAVYKLSLLMSLFIQAFRYSAEPFFFKQTGQSDSKKLYATVMRYFVLFGLLIFLGIMFYMDILKHFIDSEYHEGIKVVPILIMANLCLGIIYNLSIWYKLQNLTKLGALVSLVGAAITILLNVILIPFFGYVGSAWATFFCYFCMMVLSYKLGQKYFPINYNLARLLIYLLLTLSLYFTSMLFSSLSLFIRLSLNTIMLSGFVFFVLKAEKILTVVIKKNESKNS